MLLQRFQDHIKKKQLFHRGDLLLIAVSGGADSVALCELVYQSGFSFQMAHCNFQLRGAESDGDEDFVTAIADRYGVPLHKTRFDTEQYARENKVNTQIAARELRYQWFDTIITGLQKENRTWLLTAHHANDHIETLLMNFFKGTGVYGLQGIRERSGCIIRPLLFATRDEIITFLNTEGIKYREDSSNLSDDYTRNYFRNQVIPSIAKVFPSVEANLLNNLERFHDVGLLYRESVERHLKKLVEFRADEVHIPVLKLLKTPAYKTLLFEIVKNYGFHASQLNEVIRLLESESGKYVASASHRVIRNRGWLIVTPADTRSSAHILIATPDSPIGFPQGKLRIEKTGWESGSEIPVDSHIALVDASKLSFPLLLRPWREGDYFYPLGMNKKKKLSRFLIDQKISLPDKEKVWVLEQDKKIVWVVGMRIDNRFKVTEKTEAVCRFSVQSF